MSIMWYSLGPFFLAHHPVTLWCWLKLLVVVEVEVTLV